MTREAAGLQAATAGQAAACAGDPTAGEPEALNTDPSERPAHKGAAKKPRAKR